MGECAIIKQDKRDNLRGKLVNVIQNHKHKLSNLKPEKNTLELRRFLHEHNNSLVTKADKGNITVILDESAYIVSVNKLVSDHETYRKVKTDPTLRIQKSNNIIVERWIDNKYISELEGKRLITNNASISRFYALPKIHKENTPFRPIVSSIDSPTYRLSKFIQRIISNISKDTPSRTEDSFHFQKFITTANVPENYVLISFDVTSLYTNVR